RVVGPSAPSRAVTCVLSTVTAYLFPAVLRLQPHPRQPAVQPSRNPLFHRSIQGPESPGQDQSVGGRFFRKLNRGVVHPRQQSVERVHAAFSGFHSPANHASIADRRNRGCPPSGRSNGISPFETLFRIVLGFSRTYAAHSAVVMRSFLLPDMDCYSILSRP